MAAIIDVCDRCGSKTSLQVSASWTIAIDRMSVSLNAHIVNHGPSRYKYKKHRDTWAQEFMVARVNQKIPRATSKRFSVITRRFKRHGQVLLDYDNLVGGMKPLVDALVIEQLLLDDSDDGAIIRYKQCPAETGGVTIQLYELAPA